MKQPMDIERGRDADGEWTPRFVAAPPRLLEAIVLYASLGYEVRTRPVFAPPGGCAACAPDRAASRAIFTRRRT